MINTNLKVCHGMDDICLEFLNTVVDGLLRKKDLASSAVDFSPTFVVLLRVDTN